MRSPVRAIFTSLVYHELVIATQFMLTTFSVPLTSEELPGADKVAKEEG